MVLYENFCDPFKYFLFSIINNYKFLKRFLRSQFLLKADSYFRLLAQLLKLIVCITTSSTNQNFTVIMYYNILKGGGGFTVGKISAF